MNNLMTATQQRDCHAHQVSGVWSINAEDFCKQTGIPNLYDDAVVYQMEKESDDNLDHRSEQLSHYENAVGELSESQREKIEKDCEDVGINDAGYSYYFWDYVVKKIKEQK